MDPDLEPDVDPDALEPDVDRDGLRPILISNRYVRDVYAESIETWQDMNNPPTIFRKGTTLVRLIQDDAQPRLEPLTGPMVSYHLDRIANFVKEGKNGPIPASPPPAVVSQIMATPIPPFPACNRVVTAPVFAPDGTLISEFGYHEKAETYVYDTGRFVVPPIPMQPTSAQIEAAKSLLLDDLLGDFPFVHRSEKAHALCLLLLPAMREMISGPTPLHVVEAPTSRTGKSLLVQCTLGIMLGFEEIPTMSEGTQEEEWRKRVTSILVEGAPAIIIDNLRDRLDSAALAKVLTDRISIDRQLGQTRMLRSPVRAVFVATGNNPTYSTEVAERSIRIRLDAGVERPGERGGFRHDPLPDWVEGNRGELVAAALTLGQAWVAAGMPSGGSGRRVGGYEAWVRVMGGILDVIGVPGFLENRSEVLSSADPTRSANYRFVRTWWERHGRHRVTVAQLFPYVTTGEAGMLPPGPEHNLRIQLGTMLRDTFRDQRYGDVVVRQGPVGRGGSLTWFLEPVAGGPTTPTTPTAETDDV